MSHCSFACVLSAGTLRIWPGYGLHYCGEDFPYVITLIFICLSLRPESMASLLPSSSRTPVAPGLKYFEMPKTQMDETEPRPKRTFPNIQPTLPPFPSEPKQNPDFQDNTSASVEEHLVKPRSHFSRVSIKLGNPVAQPEPAQPLSPTNSEPTSRSLQGPLLHMPQFATVSDTKPIGRIGMAHKKEALTMDLG